MPQKELSDLNRVNVYLPRGYRDKLEALESLGVIGGISIMVQQKIDDLTAENLPSVIDDQIKRKEAELERLKEIQKNFTLKESERKPKLDALVSSFKRYGPDKNESALLEWVTGHRTECYQVFGKGTSKEYLEKIRSRLNKEEGL